MPLAFAPTGFRIAHFDDDGPMARRSLTDVPFHLRFLLTPLEVRTGDLFLRQSS